MESANKNETGLYKCEWIKQYAVRKDKNIPLLSEYAKEFHVEEKVRRYLEVLI